MSSFSPISRCPLTLKSNSVSKTKQRSKRHYSLKYCSVALTARVLFLAVDGHYIFSMASEFYLNGSPGYCALTWFFANNLHYPGFVLISKLLRGEKRRGEDTASNIISVQLKVKNSRPKLSASKARGLCNYFIVKVQGIWTASLIGAYRKSDRSWGWS